MLEATNWNSIEYKLNGQFDVVWARRVSCISRLIDDFNCSFCLFIWFKLHVKMLKKSMTLCLEYDVKANLEQILISLLDLIKEEQLHGGTSLPEFSRSTKLLIRHFSYPAHCHNLLWKFGKNRSYNSWETEIFVNSHLNRHFQGQIIKHFCCRPRCHYCGRNLIKIGSRIAEISAKWCNATLTMTLIYDVKVIPFNLLIYLIVHYFSKNVVKIFLKKDRLHSSRDIRCFHFFPFNTFCTSKRKTKLCGNPLARRTFVL